MARSIATSAARLEGEAAPAGIKEFTEAWSKTAPSTLGLPEFPTNFLAPETSAESAVDGERFSVNFYTPHGLVAQSKVNRSGSDHFLLPSAVVPLLLCCWCAHEWETGRVWQCVASKVTPMGSQAADCSRQTHLRQQQKQKMKPHFRPLHLLCPPTTLYLPHPCSTLNHYTPQHQLEQVLLPGVEGYFGVKANHVPIIAQLKPGVVELHDGTDITKYFVSGGFAFVHPNSTTDICVLEAATLDQFDSTAVKSALQVGAVWVLCGGVWCGRGIV